MKLFTAYCLVLLFVSCDSSEKKNKEVSSEIKETTEITKEEKSKTPIDDLSLPQNGDYSTLFNLKKDDCSFITATDIATALSLPENAIQGALKSGRCNYDITLNDDSKWAVSFQWHSFSKDQITREIKNYTDEGSPLIAIISETKDTYLCIHPFNKFLMLYNDNYNGTIQISYCQTECRKLSKEQKETRKQLAITLSNYLLQKHKN